VNTAATLFRGSDRGRRPSVHPLVGNDLLQAFDAKFGEGRYAFLSVVLYIVVPVIVAQLWRHILLMQGGQAPPARTLLALAPLSLSALPLTLVLLFGLQGEQIMRQPIVIALLAVPILIQVYFNAGLAYWLNRRLGVEWCVAGPSALIGASNFFELALATAIALFGFQSGARSQRSSACSWKCRSCCRSSTSSAARVDGMRVGAGGRAPHFLARISSLDMLATPAK
jgi:hypothetical protein